LSGASVAKKNSFKPCLQDLEKLEKVVWEGYGQLLIKHTSGVKNIPAFLFLLDSQSK
jgi:hypothetical protein